MLTVGQQFEGLRINKILGESYLTTTFLAERRGNEKIVLKVFKDEAFIHEKEISYLRRPREAITQGKLTNQAYLSFCKKVATAEIPRIGKRAYLVRGYVTGKNLAEWSKSFKSWAETTNILRKISQGLNHLHGAGLIHGAFCPQDVIVGEGTVKITDFGTGAGFLIPMLKRAEFNPENRPFRPPWYNDSDKFQSPLTDIYALGAMLYFLEKGAPPEGIPEDASLPVKMALMGEYGDVGDFLAGIELLAEQEGKSKEAEAQKNGSEQGEEAKQGGKKSGVDKSPERAPRIEIQGQGLEPEDSGLSYRLEKRLKKKGGRFSFVLKNLSEDGRKVAVRVKVASGSDWMRVEPVDVRMLNGEQQFRITLGPVKTTGIKTGKIVIEISFDEGVCLITKHIRIMAEFTRFSFCWSHELINKVLAWMRIQRWRKLSVISFGLILMIFLFHEGIRSGPLYMEKVKDYWSYRWTGSEKSKSIQHFRENVAEQLNRIENSLLAQGKYQDALRELKILQVSFPDHQDINTVLDQIGRGLNIQSELILPPGQKTMQGEMVNISSGSGFRLQFIPNDACYLYIYQLDSHNNVTQLFPNIEATSAENPLQGGKTYQIPAGDDWFILDRNTGQEVIYFVASRWPSNDLEQLFARFNEVGNKKGKDEYRLQLLERIKERPRVHAAGLAGFFYKEFSFHHE